ncbi:MAG: class I SAM-dependent methyltransferase [Oscillospiraceae bacterium]
MNDETAGRERWNLNAESYAALRLPSWKDSMAMRIIEREKMLEQGNTVLDVGCGGGRFSFALEAMGANVSAADLSPKMIEQAEKIARARGSGVGFSVDDWHKLSLKEKGWEKSFDLVLAHMTPAVASAETFLKLSDASRNWVLMVKPTRRTNSVLDELNRLVNAPEDKESLDEALAYAFDLAWHRGYCPKLEYENQLWESDLPLGRAIEEYSLRIASTRELTKENEAEIRAYLSSVALNGVVHESSRTMITAMFWQVKSPGGG